MGVYSDNFTRANSASLGANWTEWVAGGSVGGGLSISSNTAVTAGGPSSSLWWGATWTANTVSTDQFSQFTVATLPASQDWIAAVVRATNTDNSQGYIVLLFNNGAGWAIDLFRNNGTASPPLLTSFTPGTPSVGDVLTLAAVGSTITVTYNGTQVITQQDTTWTSGQPGLAAFRNSATIEAFASWTGGDAVQNLAQPFVQPPGLNNPMFWRLASPLAPPQVAAPVSATFYQLNRPVGAVVRPSPIRGHFGSNAGIRNQTGTAFYPLNHPLQARQPLPPRGRTRANAGIRNQAGPQLYPLQRPVQARQPLQLPVRGRAQGRAGTFTAAQAAAAVFRPLGQPARARLAPPTVRGICRTVVGYPISYPGPQLYPLQGPVRSRLPQQPLLKGRVSSRPGVYSQTGPAVTPLQGPVAARIRPLPPRGRAQGRAGAPPPAIQAGPPVYPLRSPVAAVTRPQPPRGRSQGHAGVFQGSGPAVKPLQHPVYAWRPGPRRGVCLTSVQPPAASGTGSTFYPLRKPVRAPYPPFLRVTGGFTQLTPPYVPPFVAAGGHGYPYDARLQPARWSGRAVGGEWKAQAGPGRYSATSAGARWPATARPGRWFTTSGPA